MNRQTTLFLILVTAASAAQAESIKPRYVESYPSSASKKGLQVERVDDALQLGVKHAALNINLSALVDPTADPSNPQWDYNGKTYHFRRAYLREMDDKIRVLSENGVLVNLIVLAYQSRDPLVNQLVLHPHAVAKPPNRLCAFNTLTEDGRNWFVATLEFMAERWSHPEREHGRVIGYIIGNEVNSHWWWCNMGRVSMEDFADDYLRTVRLAHGAIRRQSSWARVYLSLEHHWTVRYTPADEEQAFPGRSFLDYFAQLAREQGDFDWHLAFHPYPEDLRNPRFWNDASATATADSPRITFKNIEVLCDYLRREELLYEGAPRRIILSEQGFNTPDTTNGELIQAAAYCLAYKKVEALAGVDAFILHRHIDNRHEGGLRLGLRSWADGNSKKKIYDCFQAADTPEWRSAFEFALPIVGRKDW